MADPKTTPPTNTPKEISWQALEFTEYKKHPLWFMGIAIAVALLVLYGVYSGSWTVAMVFALLGVMTIVYGAQKPKTITIRLTGEGVYVNSRLHDFQSIKKFWIIYHPPVIKALYLQTSEYLNHVVKLELGNQDPLAVKTFLKQYAEEDLDGQESVVDVIARRIKF